MGGTKVVSFRLDQEKYEEFSDAVEEVEATESEKLQSFVDLYLEARKINGDDTDVANQLIEDIHSNTERIQGDIEGLEERLKETEQSLQRLRNLGIQAGGQEE
ncbi:hypothetical protein [Saliphagus infecundisoli]|uniref:Uncharacterized protein n=1 Tax=Saliphagus infecundisoli TaxID=1849069 RepID=A0ABD5QKA6_9EURY|nr:hypothetical protein [Saliphagus infecundisoli]